jgi:hypothetical protein
LWGGIVISGDLLAIRAAEERSELAGIRACLDAAPGGLAPMLRFSLEVKLKECSARLADALPNGDGAPTDEAWKAYEAAVRMTEELRTEVFCYVAGVLLRRDGIDKGVGRAADLLLEELAEHAGLANRLVTSLSFTTEGESLNRIINLVRLRFPGAGVWDLPILAHEFGHHVMRELPHVTDRGRRPIVELAHDLDPTSEPAAPIEELFADVCATYALGAAYPLSCVVLRLPRRDLDVQTESHPTWRYRVSAMIETLLRMTELTGLPRYRIAADRWVQPQWEALSGGQAPGAGSADIEALKYRVHRMTGELRHHASELLYDGGNQADVVADMLVQDAAGARLPAGCTVAHVLNGAWRWRLENADPDAADDLVRVGAAAIAYCKQV